MSHPIVLNLCTLLPRVGRMSSAMHANVLEGKTDSIVEE